MRKHNLAFVDIETTGLNLIEHEIIEIGCIVTDASLNIIKEFELKIKPKHIKTSDPIALKINHYDLEDWKGAVSSYYLGGILPCGVVIIHDACFVQLV